jgi:hypothetical protein
MKWTYLFFLPVFFILLVACSDSAVTKKLSGSDSLVISFNAPNSDSIIKTLSATQANAIRKMAGFIDTKAVQEFKCGYDGHLIFYSKGQAMLPVVFKYREADCRHFLFEWEGKTMSTKLSGEAADFLESLEKGSSSY